MDRPRFQVNIGTMMATVACLAITLGVMKVDLFWGLVVLVMAPILWAVFALALRLDAIWARRRAAREGRDEPAGD